MVAQTVHDAALDWTRAGYHVVPVPHGQKGPTLKGWPDLRITPETVGQYFNGAPQNIGILLGEPSSGLTDIDLDCQEAADAAAFFFPDTFTYGRASRRRSHLLLRCADAKTRKYQHDGKVLTEIRSTGCQSLLPPSTHPSGETYEREGTARAAPMALSDLETAAGRTAAAALLAMRWTDSRHDKALALAGALRHAGWPADDIRQFIEAVTAAAGDEEAKDRLRAVEDTAKADKHTGWPTLARLVGDDVTQQIREWLGVQDFPALTTSSAESEPPRFTPPISAAALMAMDLPEPRFVVDDMLPEGTTLLVGRPKLGKSWMALHLAIAVATQGMALEWRRAHRGRVLYLSLEDTVRRFKKRLAKLLRGAEAPELLDLCTDWPRVDQGGLAELESYLKAHPDTVLVIIDTLKAFRMRSRAGANQYDVDYEHVQGIKRLADRYGVAMLCVHHTRKGHADDPLEEISGSFGLSGGVDGTLVLRRERGSCDATLFASGRDIENEQYLALQFDNDAATWRVLGVAEDFLISPERRQVLELLKRGDFNGREITERLGREYPSTKVLLNKMAKDQQIVREGGKWTLPDKGKRGDQGNQVNQGNDSSGGPSVAALAGESADGTERLPGYPVTFPPDQGNGGNQGNRGSEVTGNSSGYIVCVKCQQFDTQSEACAFGHHIGDPYQPMQSCPDYLARVAKADDYLRMRDGE